MVQWVTLCIHNFTLVQKCVGYTFRNGIARSECVCAFITLIDTAEVPSVESVSPLHISPALCQDVCFFLSCQYE